MGHRHDDNRHYAATGATASARREWPQLGYRLGIAGVIVIALLVAASVVIVPPGEAIVITRFGEPVRVLTRPGPAFKLPAPIEDAVDVNLRLRTTLSGLHDVGTKDGLRIIVQAYIAWQVRDDPDHILRFLRAVRNRPDFAAMQLRSFIGSNLEITASVFDLDSLINTDPSQVALGRFEDDLRRRLDRQALTAYGITVPQVGIDRLTLPAETLDATIDRMKAERLTVAAEQSAEGRRKAAEIEFDASRDARGIVAKAKADAAAIDAKARVQAAEIYSKAYSSDPQLYTLLRSFDTLDAIVNKNTRLILRTDAAPFRVLVEGPVDAANKSASQGSAAK